MKDYITPEIEIIEIKEDVLTASSMFTTFNDFEERIKFDSDW